MNRAQSATKTQTNKAQKQPDDDTSYQIIDVNSWNVKDHTFGTVKVNNKGSKSISMNYGRNGLKFYLKVPRMQAPFGATPRTDKDKSPSAASETPSWSLQLAMIPESKECQLFQKKAQEFDELMIDQGLHNWVQWLGMAANKNPNRDVVESKYMGRMLKFSQKDGVINTQYPPYIRLGVPLTFKEPYELTCEIYDQNSDLIPNISLNPNAPNSLGKIIPAGCQCSALISGSVWASSAGFGVTWKVVQLKVFPSKLLPKGRCLVDDPDDEESQNEYDDNSRRTKEKNGGRKAIMNDFDEEEQVVEEEIYE